MCARAAPAQQQHASHEGSCALLGAAAATQFAVGWHKALQQCQEPLKRLQQRPRRTATPSPRTCRGATRSRRRSRRRSRACRGATAAPPPTDQKTGQVHQVVSDYKLSRSVFTLIVLYSLDQHKVRNVNLFIICWLHASTLITCFKFLTGSVDGVPDGFLHDSTPSETRGLSPRPS